MENYVNNSNITENFQKPNFMQKETFELSRKDFVFAILFCFTSVLLSIFGICGGFSLGYSVSMLLIFMLFTVYLCNKSVKIRVFPLVCGLLACGCMLCFTITSNGAVCFLSGIFVFVLSLAWYVSLVKEDNDYDDFTLISNIVSPLIIGVIPNIPVSLTSLFSGEGGRRKTIGKVLIGILASLPALTIIIPLLMSSDEAFQSMMNKLFGNLFATIFKIIFGLIIFIFILTYAFTIKKQGIQKVEKVEINGIENTFVISFLSVISISYILYLFSQLAYFFSAFQGILPADYSFTVSEYARRGFFEMCAIAVINIILILAMLLFSRKKDGHVCVSNKVIGTFICVFSLIIIATALSKMILYIKSFGMTELRITTSAFMVFLAIVFMGVILRIFIKRIRLLRIVLISAGCILLILGTVNVNSVIAKYNYSAYKTGLLKEIDVSTIYDVGDEGIPYLVLLAEDENSAVAESAKENIFYAVTGYRYYEIECTAEEIEDLVYWEEYHIIEKKHNKVGEYSIPKSKAYEILDKYIEEHPEILKSEIYSYNTEY